MGLVGGAQSLVTGPQPLVGRDMEKQIRMYIAMDAAKISQIFRVTGTIMLGSACEEALPELS